MRLLFARLSTEINLLPTYKGQQQPPISSSKRTEQQKNNIIIMYNPNFMPIFSVL